MIDLKNVVDYARESLQTASALQNLSGLVKSVIWFFIVLFLGLTFCIIVFCIFVFNEFLHILETIGEYQEPYYVRDGVQLVTYSIIGIYFYLKLKAFLNEPPIGYIPPENKYYFYQIYDSIFGLGYGISLRDTESIDTLIKKSKLRPNDIKRIIIEDFFIGENGLYYPDLEKIPVIEENI